MPRFLTSWFPAAAGFAALAGVAFTAPAQAVPLVSGNFITFGDTTVTIEDCTGLCGNGELVASGGSFLFDKLGGGGGAMLNVGEDISVFLEVTTTGHDIMNIALSATGTGNASVGETAFDNQLCGIGSGTAQVGAGTTSIPLTYPGSGVGCSDNLRDIFISKDMSANDGSIFTVSQSVPEPAGVAALAVGMLGLFWMRRRSA